jgi:hypothetical protein
MPVPYFRVPLNLPHASRISNRILYHLQRIRDNGSTPANTLSIDCALSHANDLVDCLRLYRLMDDNPPASECKQVAPEAARLGRALVDAIESGGFGDDRLGQAVRNLFECLELGEEGARISLRAGENPDSALRPK